MHGTLRLVMAAAAIAGLAACTPEQRASGPSLHLAAPGTLVSGRVSVGRLVFDLPEGQWTVVSAREERRGGSTSDTLRDAQVMLMRFREPPGDRVTGLISVVTNVTPGNIFWNRNPSCENRTSLHLADSYRSMYEHDCWYVRAWRPNWKFDNAAAFQTAGVQFAMTQVPLEPISFIGTLHWIARNDIRALVTEYHAVSTFGDYSRSSDDWIEAARRRVPSREKVFGDWVAYSARRHGAYVDGLTGRLAPPDPARPTVAPGRGPVSQLN